MLSLYAYQISHRVLEPCIHGFHTGTAAKVNAGLVLKDVVGVTATSADHLTTASPGFPKMPQIYDIRGSQVKRCI